MGMLKTKASGINYNPNGCTRWINKTSETGVRMYAIKMTLQYIIALLPSDKYVTIDYVIRLEGSTMGRIGVLFIADC